MKKLLIREFVFGDNQFHIARVKFHGGKISNLHSHNFYEIFWIEKGKGEHFINGKSIPLNQGQLFLVMPDDLHEIRSGDKNFTFVNIAFNSKILEDILKQHSEIQSFYKNSTSLRLVKLKEKTLNWLSLQSFILPENKASLLKLKLFLFQLFDEILCEQKNRMRGAPDWLQNAMIDIERQKNFVLGTTRFAQLAGKTPEHMSRFLKKLGSSPTKIVNKARMNYAVNELIMTDREIFDISLDCGFQSLGHFYKCFREFQKISPAKFRKINQSVN